ncbi:hypothetical protein VPHG_00028 [Vibrio phage 11895-B1]|uniref:hypothetical protein n=1 Tax=Vibrio phage 11895-B1 TaxID=754075 RepID=UPI0002C0F9A2|nr:hypothetical protein VPHG_00028 [Vibrio phage 11895-B1]AGH32095.1 hypothetical protein VPHG_00028 [Vibrio phage 11895-B1]
MTKPKITEQEVAEVTSILFKHWGYDLYYECQLDIFGGRPDIIATRGANWCAVIETKAKFSYDVLEQVCRWHMQKDYLSKSDWFQKKPEPQRLAVPNFLWIATGNSRQSKMHDMKKYLLDKFRIGWIDIELEGEYGDWWWDNTQNRYPDNSVDSYGDDTYGRIRIGNKIYDYRVMCEAGIQQGSRQTSHHIIERLLPEMQDSVAGVTSDKSNYVTPFKLTLKHTVEAMKPDTWYSSKDLLEALRESGHDHHYSKDATYKSSIGGWLIKFGYAESDGEWNKKFKKIVDSDDNQV